MKKEDKKVKNVFVDGKEIAFTQNKNLLCFEKQAIKNTLMIATEDK